MRSRRDGLCLSDDAVVAYLYGQLDAVGFERVTRHLSSCPDCAMLVVGASAVSEERSQVSGVDQDPLDRFELLELIGTGGMGSVYRAIDHATGAIVAVKRLGSASLNAAPATVMRFAQESRILQRLAHPNIVRVITTIDRDAEHQIVMEYVAGGSLRRLLGADRRLGPERAVPIALELSDALARAHHLGVIHRDVKPENVLIAEDGTPRLADFGLARLAGTESTGNVLVGTVPYLSPEALSGARLDEKTDLWALGILLFEMLVGHRPFRGDTPAAVMAAILRAQVPLAALAAADVAPDLIDLTRLLLSRDRDARPSARQTGAALEAIVRRRPGQLSGDDLAHAMTAFVAPSGGTWLPTPAGAFVGRRAELESVSRLLAQPDVRLLTIVAPGGMGKSRLAVEVARRLEGARSDRLGARFRHGVFFVNLTVIDRPEQLASLISAALALNLQPGGDTAEQLREHLREKELLIVLDNFEHLASGSAFLASLLESAPGLELLVTSRVALNLSAETRYSLSGLCAPEAVEGDDSASDALGLFVQHARRLRADFEPSRERAELVRVCRLVEGAPLGIILAASWISVLSVAAIADEIARSVDFLRSNLQDLPERQRSLRAVFEHSWRLLGTDDRATFARLSVFRGGFTRRAAEAVALASAAQLATLELKSFVTWQPSSGRYHAHELLRQFGEAALRESAEAHAETMHRLGAHAGELLREREPELQGPKHRQAVRSIEADLGNVREGFRWLLETQQIEHVASAQWGMLLFHYRRGSRAELSSIFADVIAAFSPFERWGASGHRVGALAHLTEGILLAEQGDKASGRKHALSARRLVSEACDSSEHGLALITGAWLPSETQGRAACLMDAERGLAMCRSASSSGWHLAFALMLMARVYYRIAGDELRAEAVLRESIALQRDRYGSVVLTSCLGGLAVLANARGDWATARDLMLSTLELAERQGDVWSTQDALQLVSGYELSLGDLNASERTALRCIEFCKEFGPIHAGSWSSQLLGDIMVLRGRLEEAEARYSEAATGTPSYPALRARARMKRADLLRSQGRFREAESELIECSSVFRSAGAAWGSVGASRCLGVLACDERRFEAARVHLREALSLAVDSEQPALLLDAVAGVSLLHARTGNAELGAELCGLLKSHRLADYPLRELRIEPLLQELRLALPRADFESAQRRGGRADLLTFAKELLERSGGGDHRPGPRGG